MSAAPGGTDLVAPPTEGRLFTRERRVRLGDASPAGRLRLDAVMRYAQDLARDDSRDADLEFADAWVVRRTSIEVAHFPVYDEELTLTTWCSGVGSRWADRRTSIVGEHGGRVDVVSLWVAVDPVTGRPRVLGPDFAPSYGVSAQGRTVSARLQHASPAPDAAGEPWPLRFTDFDLLGHVNNAAYWEPVEEVLAHRRDLRAPLRAELEHPQAIELGAQVRLVRDDGDDGVALWLVGAGGAVHSSALLRMGP